MLGVSNGVQLSGHPYRHCRRPENPKGRLGPKRGGLTTLGPKFTIGRSGRVATGGPEIGSNKQIGRTGLGTAGATNRIRASHGRQKKAALNGRKVVTMQREAKDRRGHGVHTKRWGTISGAMSKARTHHRGVTIVEVQGKGNITGNGNLTQA